MRKLRKPSEDKQEDKAALLEAGRQAFGCSLTIWGLF